MAQTLDIAEVVRLTGLTSRALRFYEARGLVTPLRSASGRRHFGPVQLERLHQIMAMKRAGLTLAQIEKFSAGRKIDLTQLITAQMQSLNERQRELEDARNLLSSILSRLDRSEPIDVETFCSLIRQGETKMSHEKWLLEASSFLTDEQRKLIAQVKASFPAGFDKQGRMAAMEAFQALNARIKTALPLDPASEQAQQFLRERDELLKPFIAAMPQELKDASNRLKDTIERGDLPPPIDADVDRFYREARQARDENTG